MSSERNVLSKKAERVRHNGYNRKIGKEINIHKDVNKIDKDTVGVAFLYYYIWF